MRQDNEELINLTSVDEKWIDQIKKFYYIVREKSPAVDQTLFLNNIKTLKIEYFDEKITSFLLRKINLFLRRGVVVGQYYAFENKIYLVKENKDEENINLNHELFHFLSTVVDEENNTAYCGFSKFSSDETIFGEGFNEGYTSLMDGYHFGNENATDDYQYQRKISKEIEDIIGHKKMEKAYSQANLAMLINELTVFNSNDKVLEFLTDLDRSLDNLRWIEKKKIVRRNKQFIEDCHKSTYCKSHGSL